MRVRICACFSAGQAPRPAASAALDAHAFDLSHGNCMEHLSELFFDSPSKIAAEMSSELVAAAAREYIAWLAPFPDLSGWRRWHLDIACKTLALAEAACEHGADLIVMES